MGSLATGAAEMNIKVMLIEKERKEYIDGDATLAKFFADTLEYIIELENLVNSKDRVLENLYGEINGINAREKSKDKSNKHTA